MTVSYPQGALRSQSPPPAMIGAATVLRQAPRPGPPTRLPRQSLAAALPAAAPPPPPPFPRRLAAAGRPSAAWVCAARRTLRYGGEEEEEGAHNAELAMVELFSTAARGQAFLLQASVHGEDETVLVFRGFSSLLSSGTSADLARSVLPANAVIWSVDVVRGPFDPSNIDYLERDVPWNEFKARLVPSRPST
ncbi:uncharacterized protein LOC144711395 [Wolffia australiana]